MGKQYISLGHFNKKHLYIVYSIIFLLSKDILSGVNYNYSFKEVFSEGARENFSSFALINNTFCYIGTFFLSFIFYNIELKSSLTEATNKNINPKNLEWQNSINDYILFRKKNKSENSIFWILFVIFLWNIEENAIQIFNILKDLDFWMIEIIIISFLMIKILHITLYQHQMLIIVFNIIPTLVKCFSIVLSFIDEGNHQIDNNKINYEYIFYEGNKNIHTGRLKNLYVIFKWIAPVGILFYLLLITLRSYINLKIKVFMDLKYISPNKLLMIYGAMGAIICSIVGIITTFEKCEETINKDLDIYDYICLVNKIDFTNNITTKYFDNFSIYSSQIKNVFFEIIRIIAQIIFFFLNKYFSILIIKFFTPTHLIISFPVYYFILKIILIINTLIRNHSFFDNSKKLNYKTEKFLLDIFGDITSIVGFLVYLEIIELNFCGLNYNLRKNIINRGISELYLDNEKERGSIDEYEFEFGEVNYSVSNL